MYKIKEMCFLAIIFLALVFSGCSTQQNSVKAQTNTQNNVGNLGSETNRISNQKVHKSPAKILQPEIISRKSWNAKKPIGKGKRHKIKFITIHHTASKQKTKLSIEKKLRNLQNFSQSNAKLANGKTKPVWFDIPYHFYIASNGKIGEARQIDFAGDTNTNYDPTGHALIVLEGNFEKEKPTANQIESMKNLTLWLANKYNVSLSNVKAHNDYTKTACPGKNLKKLLSANIFK